jgi:hypothetical protein
MIELSALFETKSSLAPFKGLEAELRAVQSRDKAMSVFCFQRSPKDDDVFANILQIALDAELLVVQHTEKIELGNSVYEQLYVFVLNKDQTWRIPAYIATRKILRNYTWSDGAEYLESFLLGYSDDQISSWMTNIRKTRASWTGCTFYFLMTKEEREALSASGMRYLDRECVSKDIIAFFSRGKFALKNNVLELIPQGIKIGRVSVKLPFFVELFGESKNWGDRDIILSSITKANSIDLNHALESNFQFLDSDGWE